MLILLDDLLDISIIESGKLDLALQPAFMKDLLCNRIEMNRTIAEKKGIIIHTDFLKTPYIRFDLKRMGQVIDNLFNNAIKFSPPESEIFITLSEQNGMIKVSIRNQGPGIRKEERDKLFREFQCLSAKPTCEEKSTGLGLAIVRKIVAAHNGKLEVVSEPGQGAEFSFLLPVRNQG
jgi:signal transduction histidine kinase